MQLAGQKQQKGQDVSPIQKIMEKVGPLLQEMKFAEAEKLADQALKLLE